MRATLWRLLLATALVIGAAAPVSAGDGARIVPGHVDDSQFPRVRAVVSASNADGAPIGGLRTDRWEVLEADRPVGDLEVRAIGAEPLALALVFDGSVDLQGAELLAAKQSALELIRGLGTGDAAALVLQGRSGQVVQPFTRDRRLLNRQLEALPSGSASAPSEALALAAKALAEGTGRRVVAIVTSGRTDEIGDAARVLRETSGAVALIVGNGPAVDRQGLDRLARATGGIVVQTSPGGGLRAAFQGVLDHAKSQYELRFTSTAEADDTAREVAVRATTDTTPAEGRVAFRARSAKPAIKVLWPKPDASVAGQQRVEIQVGAIAPVRRVDLSVDGKPVAAATLTEVSTLQASLKSAAGDERPRRVEIRVKAPAPVTGLELFVDGQVVAATMGVGEPTGHQVRSTLTFDASGLTTASHRLTATVTDSAGNQATEEIQVRGTVNLPAPTDPAPKVLPVEPLDEPTLVEDFAVIAPPWQSLPWLIWLAGAAIWTALQLGGVTMGISLTCYAWSRLRPVRCRRHRHQWMRGPTPCPACESETRAQLVVRLARVYRTDFYLPLAQRRTETSPPARPIDRLAELERPWPAPSTRQSNGRNGATVTARRGQLETDAESRPSWTQAWGARLRSVERLCARELVAFVTWLSGVASQITVRVRLKRVRCSRHADEWVRSSGLCARCQAETQRVLVGRLDELFRNRSGSNPRLQQQLA